MKAVEKRR